MLNSLRRYLSSRVIWVKCGGFGCSRIFNVKEDAAIPDIYICKQCENRINEGIVQYVHAHSGKTKGNFHLIDGYTKG